MQFLKGTAFCTLDFSLNPVEYDKVKSNFHLIKDNGQLSVEFTEKDKISVTVKDSSMQENDAATLLIGVFLGYLAEGDIDPDVVIAELEQLGK